MNKPKVYVAVENNSVREVIEPGYDLEGNEYPIEARFPEEIVETMVEVTDLDPQPEQYWHYENGVFTAPIPYQRTPDEIFASNTAMRDVFLTTSSLAIDPLQDAVDLDDATAEEIALLKKWKQYRVAVNRVDLTQPVPAWPPQP
jgi:hypothetical protein